MTRPCDGVRVVDLSWGTSGNLAAMILADYGADVIKVEPVDGEYSRKTVGNLLYLKTAAGKECVAVDLKQPEGREIARRLVAKADIVVHNFRPGAPERLGIGYEDVRALNPAAVYHYGASYGPDGPYAFKAAMHPTMGAIAGTGMQQLPPAAAGPNDAELPVEQLKRQAWRHMKANEGNPDINAGIAVGSALLLGLQAREVTGAGQAQHTTMLLSSIYARAEDAIRYPGKPPSAEPDLMVYGLGPLYRLYACSEGWVFLACPFEQEWQALARALGHDDWLADPRFATAASRREHAEALAEALAHCFKFRAADDWETTLTAVDVACVRADARGVFAFAAEEPFVRANGFVAEIESAARGPFLRYGPLMTIDGTECCLGPACELGEQTRPIMRELGYADPEIDALRDRKVVCCYGE